MLSKSAYSKPKKWVKPMKMAFYFEKNSAKFALRKQTFCP